jgi:hypothetical protein
VKAKRSYKYWEKRATGNCWFRQTLESRLRERSLSLADAKKLLK